MCMCVHMYIYAYICLHVLVCKYICVCVCIKLTINKYILINYFFNTHLANPSTTSRM